MTREQLLEIAKPILFNTEMVQSILDDRKTVTRRVIKFPCNKYTGRFPRAEDVSISGNYYGGVVHFLEDPHYCFDVKKTYRRGDILWVRETWLMADGNYYYRANETMISSQTRVSFGYQWHPSIHMPKDAARIFLHVTDVRAERLQDITTEQTSKEGCFAWTKDGKITKYSMAEDQYEWSMMPRNPEKAFRDCWDMLTRKKDLDQYGWNANPWVWVVDFERIRRIDQR